MLQLDDVSLSYHGVPLLEKISFTLQKGEKCAFVGRNGSGKTTIFRLLSGKESADSGSISFPKGYRLGVLEQHIRFSCNSVLEEASLGLEENEQHLALTLLAGLGFEPKQLEKKPEDLSGGFQLRLQLIKVLLSNPDCLLLDEPTNYLDILSIRFLTRFLRGWKGEMMVISHDREFLDEVCTHTMGIHRKKMVKIKGTTSDFYRYICNIEELQEKTRLKTEEIKAHYQSYVDRFGAKASKASQASSRKKMIERLPQIEALKDLKTLGFSFHEAPFPGRKMLEAKDLFFSYLEPLITCFSLIIEKGEKIAIIGKNGCGKSTILRLLAQDLKAQKGDVEMKDNTLISYFGQTNIDRLYKDHTIEEEIGNANPLLNVTQIRNICGVMMFGGDLAKKKISVLSGGEKSRVLLGKILAHPCNLLLLDEPTHHLDVESVETLIDAIEEFQGSCVIVTHSELILNRLKFDKLVVCHASGKQEVFLGGYEEFLEKIGWEEENPSSSKSSQAKKEASSLSPSRLIKKIDQRIDEIEKAIEKEEASIQKIEEELLKNDPKKMQLLYTQLAEREGNSSKLYEELEKLFIEKETLVLEK